MKAYKETGDPIFKAKAKMSYQSLSNFAKNVPEYVELFGGGKVDAATKPDAPVYWIRDNKISHNDLEEAKAVLFGEISNRTPDKQQLEAQTILNTAFNRMEEYNARNHKGRSDWTLKEVLQMPNQYQAYGGKQYNKYKSGQLEDLDKQKLKAIEKVIGDVQNGSFINNIEDRVFYVHKPDGRIIADDRKLFK